MSLATAPTERVSRLGTTKIVSFSSSLAHHPAGSSRSRDKIYFMHNIVPNNTELVTERPPCTRVGTFVNKDSNLGSARFVCSVHRTAFVAVHGMSPRGGKLSGKKKKYNINTELSLSLLSSYELRPSIGTSASTECHRPAVYCCAPYYYNGPMIYIERS